MTAPGMLAAKAAGQRRFGGSLSGAGAVGSATTTWVVQKEPKCQVADGFCVMQHGSLAYSVSQANQQKLHRAFLVTERVTKNLTHVKSLIESY